MPNITDLLSSVGGLSSIARELGVSESQATAGAAALLPAILGGFKKQAQAQPTGLDGLGGILSSLGGGGLLDSVLSPHPTNVDAGNGVLGQIFGSKDVSRTVAADAAAKSGLDAGLLKKMLPMLAMLVAGYMAKQHASGRDVGDAREQADGSAASTTAGTSLPDAPAGGLGGMLGGVLGSMMGGSDTTPAATTRAGSSGGLGGLASMLDMNHDGNALDDVMRMAGKLMK